MSGTGRDAKDIEHLNMEFLSGREGGSLAGGTSNAPPKGSITIW